MTKFYPSTAAIPETLQTDLFRLEPLTVDHNPLDYAAVIASRQYLRVWASGDWPADDFSPEDNRADLDEHQREHEAAEAFTYTILTADGGACFGCIYIKPNTVDLLQPEDYDALVRFWVTPAARQAGLDAAVVSGLRDWLRTAFSFNRVFYHTNLDDTAQQALFDSMGLVRLADVAIPDRHGRWVIYGGAQAADTAPDSVIEADVVDGVDLSNTEAAGGPRGDVSSAG